VEVPVNGVKHHLFDVLGVEIEYMIVERDSLDVLPAADRLIKAEAGSIEPEIEVGPIAWSNELVLHVIELKTNGPSRERKGLASAFQESVSRMAGHLGQMDALLMPGAMHPWMDPLSETKLWPHEYNPVYESFNRIFDCRGHGWSNLQSMHLNLPFANDEEFGRLHSAIRIVLPLLPALAASSPVAGGKITGLHDTRLEHYRTNSIRIPELTGGVIPEAVSSRAGYERKILQPIYAALEPHDPEGVLRHEWANARGCIARFDRMAIEIRVIDVQEAPVADLAIATLTEALLRALVEGRLGDPGAFDAFSTERLREVLATTVRQGGEATIDDREYLALLGSEDSSSSAAALWRGFIERLAPGQEAYEDVRPALEVLHDRGTLAGRITRALGGDARRERLREVWSGLCRCLVEGSPFRG
jgi:gamma-glutamyl:cysteine ligase YbdK (ATP-grasp superfamily)